MRKNEKKNDDNTNWYKVYFVVLWHKNMYK